MKSAGLRVDAAKVTALVLAAREIDAALDESCEKETCLWLEPVSSDRVYKARCGLADALKGFGSK